MRALLCPEAEFLALTAGGPANDSALLEILERPFDWAALCAFARADRAMPIIWRCVQRLGCDVPEPAVEHIRRAAMVSEFELLRAEGRLRETIHALARGGIHVVLLKGAAVVHAAYGSFAERPMADFDLLVESGRIEEAQRIALGVDWVRSPGAAPDGAYLSHHHAVPLVDATGTGMQLELHTGLFIPGHPFELSADAVRRRAYPVDVGGCTVGVPQHSVLLLHTCLHFAWSHGMRKGGWRTLRDIARLAGGRPQLWDEFVPRAIEARGSTCCYWTLRLARDLAAIPVPDHVLSALETPMPEVFRTRIARHFALHLFASDVVCPSARLDRAVWNAAVLPRWSGHGRARPWNQAHGFLPARARASRTARARTTLTRQMGLVPQWTRYLRAILGGAQHPEAASLRNGM